MKLLVMSDSHRNIDPMHYAAEQTNPDAIVHLGDHIGDAQKLRQRLPDTVFHMVAGNCDLYAGENELFLTLEGVKILVTHGHKYGVKSGLGILLQRALSLEADLVLYGHTHQASVRHERGLWLMCPGQMERHDKFHSASYGIAIIAGGSIDCGIVALPVTAQNR